MIRDEICRALVLLGHGSKYWGPDQSTYAALLAGWPAANGPCPTEAALQAALDADAPARAAAVKAAQNAIILAQIEAKEKAALRSMRELSREREFHGDLTPQEKAFAQNKLRTTDQEIAALRAQLQS